MATANKITGKNEKKKGTATITMDELDRIRAQVLRTNDDNYEMQRTAQRKSLQDTSKSRVKNWPNTMEASRLKREEDRIRRLENEEVSIGRAEKFEFLNYSDRAPTGRCRRAGLSG